MSRTAIIAPLSRGESGLGEFPVGEETDLKISYIVVNDVTARDAIPVWKRIPYMTCFVIGTGLEYTLGSDLTIPGQVWTEKDYGVPSDVVTEDEIFDAEGFVQPQLIKNIFLNTSYVVDDEAEMLALTTLTGNFVIRTDDGQVYIKLNDDNPADITDFAASASPGAVVSVNGDTGVVVITIAGLLAEGTNQDDFDDAVEANSVVLGHSSSIATLQSDVSALTTSLTNKANLVAGKVPLSELPYIFNSGLTLTSNTAKLGGPLLANTDITGDFDLNLGTVASKLSNLSIHSLNQILLQTYNASEQIAIITNAGLYSVSTNGGDITHETESGLHTMSVSSLESLFSLQAKGTFSFKDNQNSTIVSALELRKKLSNVPQVGHGTSFDIYLHNTLNVDTLVSSIKFSYGTVTAGQEDLIFDVQGIEDGTVKSLLTINSQDSTVKLGEQNAFFNLTGTNYINTSDGLIVGGTVKDASALLELSSSDKGLRLTRHDDRGDITDPAEALLIYETSTAQLLLRKSGAWFVVNSSSEASSYSFINGLTEAPAGVIKWGGDLVNSVTIDGGSLYGIAYSNLLDYVLFVTDGEGSNVFLQLEGVNGQLTASDGITNASLGVSASTGIQSAIGDISTGFTAAIGIAAGSITFNVSDPTEEVQINITTAPNGLVIIDNRTGGNNVGIEYFADYSANFTAASLINKGYAIANFWALNGTSTLLGAVTLDGTTSHYALNFGITAGGKELGAVTWLLNDTSEFKVTSSGADTTHITGIGTNTGRIINGNHFLEVGPTYAYLHSGSIFMGATGDGLGIFLGSDETGDMWYKDSEGLIARIDPGAEGDVLTMGASSIPAWSKGIQRKTGSVITADIQTLGSVPITVIAAPGTDKYLNIISITVSFKYNTAVFNFAAGEIPIFEFASATDGGWKIPLALINGSVDFNAVLAVYNATASDFNIIKQPTDTAFKLTTENSGDATTGDGELDFVVYYTIEDTNQSGFGG